MASEGRDAELTLPTSTPYSTWNDPNRPRAAAAQRGRSHARHPYTILTEDDATSLNERGASHKAPRTQVLAELDTIEAILDRYYADWRERQDEWVSRNYEFEAVRQAAIRCRSRLQREEELERHLHADAPSIRVDDLHS